MSKDPPNGPEVDDADAVGVGCLSCHVLNMEHLTTFAQYCPLATAILAPLATLMDIPALTQRWYTKDGVAEDDPPVSLALSGVGLALNVIANILLIMRFSSKTRVWIRQTVFWSLGCWIAKTIIAVVNLAVYGGKNGLEYTEGFWCAVVSVCVAGIISLALLVHFCFAFNNPSSSEPSSVRSSGRKFMLSVTIFLSVIALQALVFSRLEHWAYADGIYFSIQTALTIGYGDFTPSTAAGKVLVFPFAILTISQLGNEISLIVDFIRERSRERRKVWRDKYEGAIHREAEALKPRATLVEEMRLVHEINKREAWMSQMLDLIWSAISLISFWLIGAVIFHAIEGWSYGNAVYACIVTSVTIGFGDFSPETPAGRVFFIPFVLLAVPIVTSFAVQTITGLLSTFSNRRHVTDAIRHAAATGANWCLSHTELVEHHRGAYQRIATISSLPPGDDQEERKPVEIPSDAEKQQIMVRQLLDRVVKLEMQARRLLLENLDQGVARTLLVADRNVQARNIGQDRNTLLKDSQPTSLDSYLDREEEEGQHRDEDTLEEVEKYRSLFAEILVLGSAIQDLEGEERARFERRALPPVDGRSKELEMREIKGDPPAQEGALTGLTGMLYRQHAKKLRKVYTVA